MDESVKKAMQEAQRLRDFVPPSLAEEVKRMTESTSLASLAKSYELSAFADAKKQIDAFKNLRDIAIPPMPYIEPYRPPKMPTFEETNQFQGAAVLLRRLAESIRLWRSALPEDVQPAVIALLNGGMQIDVTSLAQESFHGIRIEGQIQGQACVVLAHQSTVQLLCIAQPVSAPERPKRSIGFIIDGQSSEA